MVLERATGQQTRCFTSVKDAQNIKPTNQTVVVFLNLSKAFDTVWCQKPITKFFNVYGICGWILVWIYNFLRNRLIKVKFNRSLSESFRLHQGVPQSSVLNHTLFALFLVGVEQVVPESCKIGIFVDNIVVWKSGSDFRKLERDINFAFDEL
ncbi:putative RNA-directed DNA polymerase from transposon BS [Nephila pilipes]|uniref:Putative RNA-directed DNA polymerase from transposon BS n=1 Tax=Nephila pilipes TaxID=299642 RepID=A0A8X6P8T3_NEPPI|nr:putative RNA-directed DNA polymerase from transposon BS [Nephila pilipes]